MFSAEKKETTTSGLTNQMYFFKKIYFLKNNYYWRQIDTVYWHRFHGVKILLKKQIYFLYLNRFDLLISKINFKN
jgi:hypothetical protein